MPFLTEVDAACREELPRRSSWRRFSGVCHMQTLLVSRSAEGGLGPPAQAMWWQDHRGRGLLSFMGQNFHRHRICFRSLPGQAHLPPSRGSPRPAQKTACFHQLDRNRRPNCRKTRSSRPETKLYCSRMLLWNASLSGRMTYCAKVRSPVEMMTSAGMPGSNRPRISSGTSLSSTSTRAS
jgi:hypothetical protein